MNTNKNEEIKGVFLGIDSKNQNPILFSPFHKCTQNYNTVVIGRTGEGMSFTVKSKKE